MKNLLLLFIFTLYLLFNLSSCISQKKFQEINDMLSTAALTKDSLSKANEMLIKDTDGDGVADYYDEESDTPSNTQVDGRGRAIDSDKDGIPDYLDEEPFSYQNAVVNDKGIEFDLDQDGVPDSRDMELNTKSGSMVNYRGIAMQEIIALDTVYLSSTVYKVDTIIKVSGGLSSIADTLLGRLAFFCDTVMIESQTYDVRAAVAQVFNDDKVQKFVLDKINRDRSYIHKEPLTQSQIRSEKIEWSEFIIVELIDPSNENFNIVRLHQSDERAIDEHIEDWHWKVTPKKGDRVAQLNLSIKIKKENGDIDLEDTQTFPI